MSRFVGKGLSFIRGLAPAKEVPMPAAPPPRDPETFDKPLNVSTASSSSSPVPASAPAPSSAPHSPAASEASASTTGSRPTAPPRASSAAGSSDPVARVDDMTKDELIQLTRKVSKRLNSTQKRLTAVSQSRKNLATSIETIVRLVKDVASVNLAKCGDLAEGVVDGRRVRQAFRAQSVDRDNEAKAMKTAGDAQVSRLTTQLERQRSSHAEALAELEARLETAQARITELSGGKEMVVLPEASQPSPTEVQSRIDAARADAEASQAAAETARDAAEERLKSMEKDMQASQELAAALQERVMEREEAQRRLATELEAAKAAASQVRKSKHGAAMAALRDEVADLKNRLEAAEAAKTRLESDNAALTTDTTRAKRDLADEKKRLEASLSSEIDAVRAEATAKSKRARELVKERDAEVARLSARVTELEAELKTGAPAERSFLKYAHAQARREAEVAGLKQAINIQKDEIDDLNNQLQLARDQDKVLKQEIRRLERNDRRDGVNMEYLKNIVLQYLSFKAGAPERRSLIPVLGMLLQLSAKEMGVMQGYETQATTSTFSAFPIPLPFSFSTPPPRQPVAALTPPSVAARARTAPVSRHPRRLSGSGTITDGVMTPQAAKKKSGHAEDGQVTPADLGAGVGLDESDRGAEETKSKPDESSPPTPPPKPVVTQPEESHPEPKPEPKPAPKPVVVNGSSGGGDVPPAPLRASSPMFHGTVSAPTSPVGDQSGSLMPTTASVVAAHSQSQDDGSVGMASSRSQSVNTNGGGVHTARRTRRTSRRGSQQHHQIKRSSIASATNDPVSFGNGTTVQSPLFSWTSPPSSRSSTPEPPAARMAAPTE